MPSRLVALLLGIVYGFFGIASLFHRLIALPPPRLKYDQMHIVGGFGYLLAWLPINPLHTVLYILIGAGGVLASVTFFSSVIYLRGLFALTLGLMFLGLLPLGASYMWGLLPLFSWNVLIHAVTAIVSYYYGLIYPLDRGGVQMRGRPVSAAA